MKPAKCKSIHLSLCYSLIYLYKDLKQFSQLKGQWWQENPAPHLFTYYAADNSPIFFVCLLPTSLGQHFSHLPPLPASLLPPPLSAYCLPLLTSPCPSCSSHLLPQFTSSPGAVTVSMSLCYSLSSPALRALKSRCVSQLYSPAGTHNQCWIAQPSQRVKSFNIKAKFIVEMLWHGKVITPWHFGFHLNSTEFSCLGRCPSKEDWVPITPLLTHFSVCLFIYIWPPGQLSPSPFPASVSNTRTYLCFFPPAIIMPDLPQSQ